MADNKDVEMEGNASDHSSDLDNLMEIIDNKKNINEKDSKEEVKEFDFDKLRSTLDRYKVSAIKEIDTSLEAMIRELKLTLDRIDRGKIPNEFDQYVRNFVRIWQERRFYKTEIKQQSLINGFFQYWMYKRIKSSLIDKDILKTLGQILYEKSYFYSLLNTNKNLEEMIKEIETVRSCNPILYTHIDDFVNPSMVQASPFYCDNVNSFCKLNGFGTLITYLQNPNSDHSFLFLKEIMSMCISVKNYLQKEYTFQFFSGIVDEVIKIFRNYSDEELKSISQDEMIKFIDHLNQVLEIVYNNTIVSDEIIQNFELDLSLRLINTSYIEKRLSGLNILTSKVNLINSSSFPCTWNRKIGIPKDKLWMNSERFCDWLHNHDIFGLFFGETLHSELVIQYYAVLSFLYSKDKITEKQLELIWDCAINKHEAYRVNILKMLSSLALKIKPSHAQFLFNKVKGLELSEHCKFTLQLLKYINKNACKGPMSDQAAHEAGFGRSKAGGHKRYKDIDDTIFNSNLTESIFGGSKSKKTRSFSLGGEEKESYPKNQNKRHNSPVAGRNRDHCKDIKVSHFDDFKELGMIKKQSSGRKQKSNQFEESKNEEAKAPAIRKVEDDKQSTDEEDQFKNEKKTLNLFDIDQSIQNKFWGIDDEPSDKKQIESTPIKQEEEKEKIEELSPEEKAIKEELKEETLELLWLMSQEISISQGINHSVHKGAIDAFAFALSYCTNEIKWRYIAKIMEKLQQNESIMSICSILKKFLTTIPEGDITKIRSMNINEENIEELSFPKTRIELISKLDKDYSLMNELMSLHIEFKRCALGLVYDHLGRNLDREQSLETQSSLSSSNEAEGEDTEEEDVQTDAASRPSQQLSNGGNEDNDENDENDIEMKSASKPQALSEDDKFIVPKKRRISNNEDEEQKIGNKRIDNQSLTITDISMTDEDNKEKNLDEKFISKRSHSASHREPKHRHGTHNSPIQNFRENDFIVNIVTNSVYEMGYLKEVNERLEFLKFILKNSDEIIKPIHIKILWECHIESSFHEKERSIFFEWLSSIIKIQAGYSNTRKESLVIFDDDTIEFVFFESLLCLDFSTIPEEAYDCFEEYFVYINVQFGQLIKGSFGSYEVFETKLIGIQALWEIVLQAKDSKVHQKASKFLLTLYKKLSPDLFNSLNFIKEEFLKTCMSHIKEGVKALNEGMTSDEKENGKNRVARSLDQICKFIDEFEGLKNQSRKARENNEPKLTVMFHNQMGHDYMPKKGNFLLSKFTKIKEIKEKLCEAITPHPQEFELILLYKGKDLSTSDLKTLNDFNFTEGGNIIITRRTFFDDYITDEIALGMGEVDETLLQSNMDTIKMFGIELSDEVIKLALKKNHLKIEETVLMLTSPDSIEALNKEVADLEDQKSFVPIINKEEVKENEEDIVEEESKLNLILSNKSEYFDLLFDLLNLGVNEINTQAWNLLTQIPVNKQLYSNIKLLDIKIKEDWNSLMDPK